MWHDRWADAGAGVLLPRPFAEHRSGARCELMRPPANFPTLPSESLFESPSPSSRPVSEKTAVVTNATRGAVFSKVVPGSTRDQIVGWLGDTLKVGDYHPNSTKGYGLREH